MSKPNVYDVIRQSARRQSERRRSRSSATLRWLVGALLATSLAIAHHETHPSDPDVASASSAQARS